MARRMIEPASQLDILQTIAEDLAWYEKGARRSRRWYELIIGLGFLFGLAVTAAGALNLASELTILLGIAVTACTGLLALTQVQANSIRFRMARLALEIELLTWSEGAGAYEPLNELQRRQRLTLRRNAIVLAEYRQWQELASHNVDTWRESESSASDKGVENDAPPGEETGPRPAHLA